MFWNWSVATASWVAGLFVYSNENANDACNCYIIGSCCYDVAVLYQLVSFIGLSTLVDTDAKQSERLTTPRALWLMRLAGWAERSWKKNIKCTVTVVNRSRTSWPGLNLNVSLQATNRSGLQYWGWNNEVHMFEPVSATWTEPLTQVNYLFIYLFMT